ncbi:PAS domain-containing protein [Acerihabitans sp. TG2]|uniref:helix-turn-helix transcriptional regulator n=1 Tax=Acerihabitans sp. TG2 TaxID=3096008 RepID=UPI002B22A220|nr:PAS domain-containing protein [Acerihabitans sp. TG2]MEA9389529.1 PAS domain-containing protein [Acerihabitans sp. TG2]
MSIENTSQFIPEIKIPNSIVRLLDQLVVPFGIRDKESRIIYANQPLTDIYCMKSPTSIIGKLDCEIECKILEPEGVVAEFDKQYKHTWQTEKSYSTLELHPNALDYPYIFRKMPFFDDNGECIGMFGYNEIINIYTLNDYVKGKMPGSLLLTKPDDFFTERQCEIIFYRLQGLKAKEVANRLNLATNTFNNYMQTLYDKVGANNLDEFIEFCEKRNYHRYLPKRFLTSEAITFSSSIM